MKNIYARWGLQRETTEDWEILKNRILVLADSDKPEINKDSARLIAFGLGKKVEDVAFCNHYGNEWYLYLERLVQSSGTPFGLAKIIETTIDHTDIFRDGQIVSTLINSSGCGIRMVKSKTGWLSYPEGEKVLDKELVDGALSFLEEKASKEYIKALEHYSNRKWVECAEKNRRALEELLRQKLNSKKGLQSAIPELGKKLKALTDFPDHLRTTIMSILNVMDKNFNDSSKHQSKTYGEQECEFLIYQTGLLMRLLSKIELK